MSTTKTHDENLAKAINLFTFLGQCQQLKSTPIRHTRDYRDAGSVTWFGALPDHHAVRSNHQPGEPLPPGAPLLVVDRLPHSAPPEPTGPLKVFLPQSLDVIDQTPQLRATVPAKMLAGLSPAAEDADDGVVTADAVPGLREEYAEWLARWGEWAEQERANRPARDVYASVFSTHLASTNHPEALELILGFGLLAWEPDLHPGLSRHLFTMPVGIEHDEESGRLTVQRLESLDPPSLEIDMIEPAAIVNPGAVSEIRQRAAAFDEHPFDRDSAGALTQRLVHVLHSEGEYWDADTAPKPEAAPHAAFAPALILRKRSQRGLVVMFETIVEQLKSTGEVPAGLLPLVDPDRQPTVEPDPSPGAIVAVEDEVFLPLPLNDKQLQVVRSVDRSAQTLVQGPPGTGKTHTAAALLSHLLAQGKRVLVTAQTDRALYEVRDKLPAEIRPLSVSVVGSSRGDMSELKSAVEHISARASDHDPHESQRIISGVLEKIDGLRRERAALYGQLIEARRRETTGHDREGASGTLSEIAQHYQAQADFHDWIQGFVDVPQDSRPPLTNTELRELLALLRDDQVIADDPESQRRLLSIDDLPDAATFIQVKIEEEQARALADSMGEFDRHEAHSAMRELPFETRAGLQAKLSGVALEADNLSQRQESWLDAALADIRSGKAHTWSERAERLRKLCDEALPLLATMGLTADVVVGASDRGQLLSLAKALSIHFQQGGQIKVQPNGQPKIGVFTPRVVREASQLFDAVRVNHLPPVTAESLQLLLTHLAVDDLLTQMDRAWPANINIPEEDTLQERIQWHITELGLLRRVLHLAESMTLLEQELQSAAAPKPDWSDLASVRTFVKLVDAVAAQEVAEERARTLNELHSRLIAESQMWDTAAVTAQLRDAVADRDTDAYAIALRRVERLHAVRYLSSRQRTLLDRLKDSAPTLARAITSDPRDAVWDDRATGLADAWLWSATGAWVVDQESVDVNALQASLTHVEGRIRAHVETLAATRAWAHAVDPARLTGKSRADLAYYAQLVRSLGRGTGKYAEAKRTDIRKAMDRCRPAVPVWIMPLYRIAEQLRAEPNMFDVVIVDEASQAGTEATFLQYLAPKIVVIGDDKQVSPAAVGVDRQQLIDLGSQYLAADPYRASWQNPERSLFDEAAMRFGGRITLTEHRRCMPEIIGFSNRIAYEPDGVRLVPVRQFGADRLEPIKAIHIRDGYEIGSSQTVNPAEAEAIVAKIEECAADPRYAGKTFGVISLSGKAQAKAIEKLLMEQLDPDEWSQRDLRCGDAADFQGSERDIMFLSMVKSVEPGRRLAALTRDLYVQRYNVAASRAKDQMWLFHSVTPSDLGNPEDMRFALLDYVYGVINREDNNATPAMGSVPDDRRVEPFDSLFEQRVFNKIVDRGYVVVPQFEASGYLIDLVVLGGQRRLAIECDGDRWHGPDAYEKDLARQRDLERCGWQFFRVRESAFYVDPAAEMDKLWRLLSGLNIHPSGWVESLASQVNSQEAGIHTPLHSHSSVTETPRTISDRSIIQEDPEPVLGFSAVSYLGSEGVPSPELVEDDPPEDPVPEISSQAAPQQVAPGVSEDAHAPRRALALLETTVAVPHEGQSDRTSGWRLEPYCEAILQVPPIGAASSGEIRTGLLALLSAEGPMTGVRLLTAYVHASGGRRVGKAIGGELDRQIRGLVRSQQLIEDDPIGNASPRERTYRLPNQPIFRLRELGTRSLGEVPPLELRALMDGISSRDGIPWQQSETLFRATLTELGLIRMTLRAEETLETAYAIEQMPSDTDSVDTADTGQAVAHSYEMEVTQQLQQDQDDMAITVLPEPEGVTPPPFERRSVQPVFNQPVSQLLDQSRSVTDNVPALTPAQTKMAQSARSYLSNGGFSRKGLVEQLKYEGFKKKEAAVVVGGLDVNWSEQAARSAQGYIDGSGFSRKGLIEQLEYEGFQRAEAEHGTDQLNLNWSEQAARSAQGYIDGSGFSRKGLIEQLEYDGFQRADAEHGTDQLNLNWSDQAVRCAQEYRSSGTTSLSELVDILEYDGFSPELARQGAAAAVR